MKKFFTRLTTILTCVAVLLFVGFSMTACGGTNDNSTHASTLEELKTAIEKGGEITLDSDIKDVAEDIVITKDLTLNLNGKTISSAESFEYKDEGPWALFTVKGATVTVKGNGTIEAKKLFTFTVQSEYQGKSETQNAGISASKLIIEDGTMIGGDTTNEGTVVYVIGQGSSCDIMGGTFKVTTTDKSWILNTLDASETQNGNFKVTGGTFEGFDPSAVAPNGSHDKKSHVAEGYKVEKDGNNYKVVKNG